MEVFQAGDVLNRTFKVWGRNFVPFSLLAIVVNLPYFAFELLTLGGSEPEFATQVLVALTDNILGLVLSAGVVFGVIMDLRGRVVSIGECVSVGLRSLLPVLGLSIVVGVGVGFGTVLFIIPGILLSLMWWVAIPVMLIEKRGIFDSMQRSTVLTEGHRLGIFGILLVVGLASGLLRLVVNNALEGSAPYTFAVATLATNVVASGLSACSVGVGYQSLRLSKDGVDVEELAQVFG